MAVTQPGETTACGRPYPNVGCVGCRFLREGGGCEPSTVVEFTTEHLRTVLVLAKGAVALVNLAEDGKRAKLARMVAAVKSAVADGGADAAIDAVERALLLGELGDPSSADVKSV